MIAAIPASWFLKSSRKALETLGFRRVWGQGVYGFHVFLFPEVLPQAHANIRLFEEFGVGLLRGSMYLRRFLSMFLSFVRSYSL